MFGQLKEASLDSLKTISSMTVKPRKIAQCSVFQTSRALTVSVCFGFTKVRCNITEVLSQQTASILDKPFLVFFFRQILYRHHFLALAIFSQTQNQCFSSEIRVTPVAIPISLVVAKDFLDLGIQLQTPVWIKKPHVIYT